MLGGVVNRSGSGRMSDSLKPIIKAEVTMRWSVWGAVILVLAVLAGLAGCAAAGPDTEGVLVLRGRVIDGTGATPIEDGIVVIEGERIRCAGSRSTCRPPRGAQVIDAGKGTILPGLIDLHTHARPHYRWMFLAAGVTTARDLNNDFAVLDELGRDGPDRVRFVWSGPLVDGPKSVLKAMGGEIMEAATPEAARAAIDTLAARGVGVVKLYEQIPPAAFRAAVARAAELGLPAAADLGIQFTRGLRGAEVDALEALEAGVTSIEHLSGFALAYRRLGGDPAREPLDPVLIDSLARAVVRHDAAVVPTLIVYAGFAAESLDFAEEVPLADRLPEGMAEWWTGMHGSLSPAARETAAADLRLSVALLRRIHELGGRIGAGSDTPAGPFDIPGGGLHHELRLLVELAGLSPLEALHAATGEAARILGHPELGVLAAGKVADLVIVEGNPAQEIRATRNLRWVMKAGQVFTPEELLAKGITADME
jgi:imidazolonepropionase-like amidohydrolase